MRGLLSLYLFYFLRNKTPRFPQKASSLYTCMYLWICLKICQFHDVTTARFYKIKTCHFTSHLDSYQRQKLESCNVLIRSELGFPDTQIWNFVQSRITALASSALREQNLLPTFQVPGDLYYNNHIRFIGSRGLRPLPCFAGEGAGLRVFPPVALASAVIM